jgi:hypothetical protein
LAVSLLLGCGFERATLPKANAPAIATPARFKNPLRVVVVSLSIGVKRSVKSPANWHGNGFLTTKLNLLK